MADPKELQLRLRLLKLKQDQPSDSSEFLGGMGSGMLDSARDTIGAGLDLASNPDKIPGAIGNAVSGVADAAMTGLEMINPFATLTDSVPSQQDVSRFNNVASLGTWGAVDEAANPNATPRSIGEASGRGITNLATNLLIPKVASAIPSTAINTAMDVVRPGVRTARSAVGELRDVTGDQSFLSQPSTISSTSESLAQSIGNKAETARQAASAQFDFPGNFVDLNPVVPGMNARMSAAEGVLDPVNPTAKVVEGINQATNPNASGPIVVNEMGQAAMPGSGLVPVGRLQNIMRDAGKAANVNQGKWEGTVATGILNDLKTTATDQLLPEVKDCLFGARGVWKEYKETYDQGAAEKAQQIVDNPDTRLQTFTQKLTQDSKAASQLMDVLDPTEKLQARSMVLQKMLSLTPTQWPGYIDSLTQNGSLQVVFGDDVAMSLGNWVRGTGVAADTGRWYTPFAKGAAAAGVGVYAHLPAGVNEMIGGTVAAQQFLKRLNVNKAITILKRASVGDPGAIKILNGSFSKGVGAGISSLLDTAADGSRIISAFGLATGQQNPANKLQSALSGQAPAMNPLPRSWDEAKQSISNKNMLTQMFTELGLLATPVLAEDLPDEVGKDLTSKAVQIFPQAFQKSASGYHSVANGRLNDPMEQDLHKQAALSLPADKRAEVIGSLYANNKFTPINPTPQPAPSPSPISGPAGDPMMRLASLKLGGNQGSAGKQKDYSYDGQTNSMLRDLNDSLKWHSV